MSRPRRSLPDFHRHFLTVFISPVYVEGESPLEPGPRSEQLRAETAWVTETGLANSAVLRPTWEPWRSETRSHRQRWHEKRGPRRVWTGWLWNVAGRRERDRGQGVTWKQGNHRKRGFCLEGGRARLMEESSVSRRRRRRPLKTTPKSRRLICSLCVWGPFS